MQCSAVLLSEVLKHPEERPQSRSLYYVLREKIHTDLEVRKLSDQILQREGNHKGRRVLSLEQYQF